MVVLVFKYICAVVGKLSPTYPISTPTPSQPEGDWRERTGNNHERVSGAGERSIQVRCAELFCNENATDMPCVRFQEGAEAGRAVVGRVRLSRRGLPGVRVE